MTPDDQGMGPQREIKSGSKRVVVGAAKGFAQKILDDLVKTIGAVIVAAMIAGAGYWVWEPAKELWADWRAPAPKGDRIAILVSRLEGDEDGAQTKHVLQSLEEQFGNLAGGRAIHVLSYPKPLELGAGEQSEALAEAERRGQKWLERKNSDLLIWGAVAARDKVLRLRFLVREGKGGAGAKSYVLSEKLELPIDFGSDLGAALIVSVAAAISPIFKQRGRAVADVIEPAARKLAPLAANPPASFSGEARAGVWRAYALVEQKIGEERGDNGLLKKAIIYYRKALAELSRERVPLDWAGTQNNLGNALQSLGERESGRETLLSAVAAYREALKERTRERVPLGWAMTQNNLGSALQSLGGRESGTETLLSAVAAYREALKERTRERVPLGWAATQHNLGAALNVLGERESGTETLSSAVAAYREALKGLTRERVPLDWATTQNNLGAALSALGERESGTETLSSAVTAYREALKELTRERVPLDWATTQNNLGAALRALGERESGTETLSSAVSAYSEALKERTRERVPLDWAMTQNSLGNTLRVLGERQVREAQAKGCATLKQARAALSIALEEIVRARASYYEGIARNNLRLLEAAEGRIGCGQ